MATKPLIKESLFFLNACGLNPINNTLKRRILAVITITLVIHFIIELTLEYGLKWKGWDSVDDLAMYIGFDLLLSKMIVLIVNGDKIRELLKSLSKFDSWKSYGSEMQNKTEGTLKFIKRLMIIYGVAPILCVAVYILRPLFGVRRYLPFQTYHPLDYYKSYNYQLMYTIQVIDLLIAFMTMFGFDILFLSFITHILCEYKVLKFRFLNIKIKNDCKHHFEEIKSLVVHHSLILKCAELMDNIYSLLFLVQFLFGLIALCAGLLNIIVSGFTENLNRMLLHVAYVSAFLGQLLIYCVAGAYLKTESESVGDSVYGSDWWVKTQPELRKAYALIMQRAQKGKELTAGGMFPVNLITFTKILKTSMSFFMLANALYTRSRNL